MQGPGEPGRRVSSAEGGGLAGHALPVLVGCRAESQLTSHVPLTDQTARVCRGAYWVLPIWGKKMTINASLVALKSQVRRTGQGFCYLARNGCSAKASSLSVNGPVKALLWGKSQVIGDAAGVVLHGDTQAREDPIRIFPLPYPGCLDSPKAQCLLAQPAAPESTARPCPA